MSLIGLVDTNTGSNKTLENSLGLMTAATSGQPATFAATVTRGGIAVNAAILPSTPTTGTLAVDISAGNMLKWWDGVQWRSCECEEQISGGGGSGIGVGQVVNLQQGLYEDFLIAYTGTLVSIVNTSPLPAGLSLNTSTGRITGTPTVFGNFFVNLTATFTDGVGNGTIQLNIAQAYVVTFDPISDMNIYEGEYMNSYDVTYTPYPNALPITWNVTGLPEGMYWFVNGSNVVEIYGEPFRNATNDTTYTVTVSATNWAGTTSVTFNINVNLYKMVVTGTEFGQFNGTYTEIGRGFYTYDYYTDSIQQKAIPAFYPQHFNYPVRIYEKEYDPSYRIFFYEPYNSWVIDDTGSYGGPIPPLGPRHVRPGDPYSNHILPPKSGWFNPSGGVSISWVP
jgi:hypothetical protein